MNSQHMKTNSEGNFVLETRVQKFDLKLKVFYINLSQKYILKAKNVSHTT